MPKYLSIITLFFISNTLLSQNQQILDSIYSEIKTNISHESQFSSYRTLFQMYYKVNNIEKSKMALDSLSKLTPVNSYEKGTIAFTKALYYSRISELDTAIAYNEKAITNLVGKQSNENRAKALSNMGLTQRRKGNYKEAIKYVLQSLRFKDSVDFPRKSMAFDYHLIATIYGELKNYKESNANFDLAKAIYEETNQPNYVKYMEMNLGTNYSALGEYEKAKGLLLACEDYFQTTNDINAYASVSSELGQLFLDQGNLNKAEAYFRKVIAMDGKVYNKEMIASNYNKLGGVLSAKNMYQEALKTITRSLEMNQANGSQNAISNNYNKLSLVYAGLNNYKKAYEFSKLHFKMEDSLTGIKNLEVVNTLKIEHETEQKEAEIVVQNQEIDLLEKSIKVKKLTTTLYGIGMFALLAIAGLLYFGFRQKMKKDKIENDKQREIFQNELAFKKKELTSQTLHLVKKNTFLQELKDNLEGVKNSPDSFKSEYRRIMLLLKKETAEDKDWEVFKSYFSQVHNNFDHKIKEKASDISEKEIRLASFLRMNLSTKEIASMFNVLPDSVLTSKYRLKKKLNLAKEDDLTEFLSAI